jgi:hypothetical protein
MPERGRKKKEDGSFERRGEKEGIEKTLEMGCPNRD